MMVCYLQNNSNTNWDWRNSSLLRVERGTAKLVCSTYTYWLLTELQISTKNLTCPLECFWITYILDKRLADNLHSTVLNVLLISDPCGKLRLNATVEVGVLKSPGYPDHLPRGSHVCQWFVYTSAHNLITLHMTDMNLPSPCSTNYLEITEMTKVCSRYYCILFKILSEQKGSLGFI